MAYEEVIAAPYDIWVAPVGTTFPAIDAAEGSFDPAWVKFGTNGLNNQDTEGVTLNLSETIQEFTPAGSTLPVKAVRTDEKGTVGFALVDTTPDLLGLILDDASVTTIAAGTGIAGQKVISVVRGIQVQTFALLSRGISPYGEEFNAQYEFTRVYQSGSQAPKYAKGSWSSVSCEYTMLDDVAGNDPGLYRAQNAAAL